MHTRVHYEMLCAQEYKVHLIVGVVEALFICFGHDSTQLFHNVLVIPLMSET